MPPLLSQAAAAAISILAAGDVHPALRDLVAGWPLDAEVRRIERETARRLREGEFEHLIYFALQSSAFTRRPRLEPAVSAKEYVERENRQAIPASARARLDDLLAAAAGRGGGPRVEFFRGLLETVPTPERASLLAAEYRRAMEFLYHKEVESLSRQGAARREYVASLYPQRGHSSDTLAEANFALHQGLSVLRELDPASRLDRVLLVGPGMDLAPRSGLDERFDPQSLQPYALVDSLLALKLSTPDRIDVLCADINPRVVDWISAFPLGPRLIHWFWKPGEKEHQAYFGRIGSAIGRAVRRAPRTRTVEVSHSIAPRVRAAIWNVVTRRPEPRQAFDLVVATNVLLYFDARELALAFSNIQALLRPGGYFLHNHTGPAIAPLSSQTGLELVHARMVRLPDEGHGRLFDSVLIHRRR